MKYNGYSTIKGTDFIHRKRAYHIYLGDRKKYPLPYTAYEVHHIDFDKKNNKVCNLQILTPSEHDKIHEEHDKEVDEEKKKKEEEERINVRDAIIKENKNKIKKFEEKTKGLERN